ncbi:MAG: barstar family protein [Aromatoleum sp.]|jgi:RNAse (barnase) inhibitor barstar|uniref:barstar family protein n=1 Tax=Aromatoleum sp. TaxID=2307007 RepID=UPI002894669C|nr:barstar family protein [Aromatoleum sp.]MDT3670705.1 barstar family protein [Aromatoleum sp.]
MTDVERLAHLLRQPLRAGLYRLTCSVADLLGPAAQHAGLPILDCDLASCTDKAGFLDCVGAALGFPDWFGRNWDALADCLGDMGWLPADGYVIVLASADRFRAAAEADFDTALEIFDEAAQDWARDGVPMWIFVDTAVSVAGLRDLV